MIYEGDIMVGEGIREARKNVRMNVDSRLKHQKVNVENFTEKGAIAVTAMVMTTALAAIGTGAAIAIATVVPGVPPPP